jgi:hypothetical protein
MASKDGSRKYRKLTPKELKEFEERVARNIENEQKVISEVLRIISSEGKMRKQFSGIVTRKKSPARRPPRTH